MRLHVYCVSGLGILAACLFGGATLADPLAIAEPFYNARELP